MKSARLLSILLLLQTRGRVSAAELAARLEVSARTIHRDVEALSSAGVPVYAERGRNGGIALLSGYRTDGTGLTSEESQALFLLAAMGANADLGPDTALGSALRKVMATPPQPHRPAADMTSQRILVDPSCLGWAPLTAPSLGLLQGAVITDRRLWLRYRHSGDPRGRRYMVDPYGLVAKAGIWYLVADHRGRPRLFRGDRVLSASVTDAPVRRREGMELAGVWEALWQEVEKPPADLRVTARVRRTRLDMFVRMCWSNLAEHPPDSGYPPSGGDPGWAEIELLYRGAGAARPLLAFGTDVEVVRPPEVREELARTAASVAVLYRPLGAA